MGKRTFPRTERLTRPDEFQAVFERGRRVERPSVLVLWCWSPGPRKAGFAVSRQIRGAVDRNRARRRVREAYRVSREILPEGVHLVAIARPRASGVLSREILRDMREALAIVAEGCGRGAGA